jgi:hypothetical protein
MRGQACRGGYAVIPPEAGKLRYARQKKWWVNFEEILELQQKRLEGIMRKA